MNKILIAALSTFLVTSAAVHAQQNSNNVPVIKTAVYSDKTPPVRDMKIVVAGSRDRSPKEIIVENKSKDETFLWENRTEVDTDLVRQKKIGTKAVKGPLLSFPGIGKDESTPPDTDGDVGLNHYFQMVNKSFSIWDKQGNLLYGPVDNSTLWDGFIGPWTGTNDGDPIVLYDDYADRWVATQFSIETNNGTFWQLIAVSATEDPLGSYYRYAYEFNLKNDYPKFSIWPDGYYSTYNMFANEFEGAITAVMDRNAMLVGDPNARVVMFGPFPNQYSVKSAHLDSPVPPPANSPNWMVNIQKYGQQQLEVYRFETDWQNPANSTYTLQNVLPVTPFSFFNPSVREQLPQPNSSQKLDPLSKYPMNPLQYRNFGTYEAMVINQTVKVDTVAGIRWYEIRRDVGQNDWYIYQEGTYCPADGLSRWMGSIAMNCNGDIALGYSMTGHDFYPSVAYTGRTNEAPLGEMNIEEMIVIEGSSAQTTSARWGDYSAMAIDPEDDSTFWYTGEYMPGYKWGTRVVKFDFGPTQAPTAYAGPDSTVCYLEVYYGQGSASREKSVLWTTPGDGVLLKANTLTPVYFRGNGDILNGYFELTLTATGFETGVVATDVVHIDIINDVSVNLGNDTLICNNQTLQLMPQLINADSLHWSTSGDGVFSNDAIAEPFYTPGTQDVLNGTVTLSLYAEAFAPCEGNDIDNLIVVIDPCTNINELNNKTQLNVYPNPSDGIINVEISELTAKTFTLSLMNVEGKVVFSGILNSKNNSYSNSINLSYLPVGVYYVSILTEKERIIKKIVYE